MYDIYGGSGDDRRRISSQIRNVVTAVGRLNGMSLHQIGDVIDREHSTVLHGSKIHDLDYASNDPGYREMFIRAQMLFGGSQIEEMAILREAIQEKEQQLKKLKKEIEMYKELYGDIA